MGCNASKSNTNATMRMLEYEHIAANENSELKVIPSQLDNEEENFAKNKKRIFRSFQYSKIVNGFGSFSRYPCHFVLLTSKSHHQNIK